MEDNFNFPVQEAKSPDETVNVNSLAEDAVIMDGFAILDYDLSPVETTVETTVSADPKDYLIYGMVVECSKLNIREKPETDAKIVAVVPEGSQVVVDLYCDCSAQFYKVCTATGIEGYCMKEFIVISGCHPAQ